MVFGYEVVFHYFKTSAFISVFLKKILENYILGF